MSRVVGRAAYFFNPPSVRIPTPDLLEGKELGKKRLWFLLIEIIAFFPLFFTGLTSFAVVFRKTDLSVRVLVSLYPLSLLFGLIFAWFIVYGYGEIFAGEKNKG